MLKSHEKFHSENGKRLLLIADDEFINREILREILQNDYELLFAENGEETLESRLLLVIPKTIILRKSLNRWTVFCKIGRAHV